MIDAHSGRVTCLSLSSSTILSGSEDGLVRIWDMEGRCIRTLVDDTNMGMVSGLSLIGDTCVVFTMDNLARLWKTDGRVGKILKGHANEKYWLDVCMIRRMVNGLGKSMVICGSEDGRVVGWDLESGMIHIDQECADGAVLSVDCIVGDDGFLVATGGLDGVLRIWTMKH